NIEIEDLVDGSQATVGFGLREESTSDNNTHYHQFNLYMNDSTVADDNISWTNRTYFDGEANLSTLQNGTNTLKMQAQSPYIINFDFFDFRYSQYLNYTNKQFFINTDGFSYNQNYRLVFQNNFENDYDVYQLNSFSEIGTIQEQDTNSKLSFIANIYEDTKFIVMKESDYLEIENIESYFPNILTDITQEPADFLIITPEKFLSNANELISVHQEYSNLVGKPILQQDIFNQFNGGMPDPEAIRIFLEYYFSNISNDLEAVIFFGSGTFDWRNFTGNANTKNNLIYYQDDSYPYSVSDDYFVRFTVSSFPEIATGRYPATNSAELTAMIDKTRKYLQNNLAGYWKEKVLIVADDIYHSTSSNDRTHSTQAQTQGETLADFMYADKLFAIEYELDGFQNKPEASDEFVRRINEGRLISYYIGHGSYKKLGDEEYFDALTDIPALTNSEKLTLFIAASCSVAQDDSYAYDSLAKKMFVYNNGGAFASIAATRACGGSANTNLMKTFMDYVLEDGETIGEALRLAKVIHNSSNSERYIIFGDPLVHLNYPHPLENIDFSTQFDSLQARQTVEFSGDFELSQNSDAILCIYDSEQDKRFDYSYTTNSGIIYSHIDYTQSSNRLFNGTVSLENGEFDSAFIVPDDIYGGNDGKLFTYLYDSVNNIDYNCYHAPIKFSGHDYIAESDTPPEIEIYIDNETFQNDDVVSKSPLLIANISDENGLNILAEPGHNMIMIIDDSSEPINVTSGFIYNKDSYTSGQLTWQIEELEEGEHKLDLIVFDNFNNPAIATAKFFTKSDNKLSIDNLLPYPSPFTGEREFHFTFTLTEKADVSVYIYTISGKKIKTITSYNLSSGFVKIP
ncbi:MAG: C25 family cysteine peptidase, partial [Candidatus Cloacimonadota bacterium]|nr:C25 family cysteine peptidase [Candidatus Cloacimonadota bacterium]